MNVSGARCTETRWELMSAKPFRRVSQEPKFQGPCQFLRAQIRPALGKRSVSKNGGGEGALILNKPMHDITGMAQSC